MACVVDCFRVVPALAAACVGGLSAGIAPGATYRVVAHQGMAAPGGGTFWSFGQACLSEDGRVAFRATTSPAGAGSGVFTDVNGGLGELSAIVAEGVGVPGLDGTHFGSLGVGTTALTMNASGGLGICTVIEGVQAEYGDYIVMRYGGGVMGVVAAPGQLVWLPCGGVGCTRWFTDLANLPAITPDGQMVFNAAIDGTGVENGNDSLILKGDPDGFEVVVREGDPSPWAGLYFGDARSDVAQLSAGETISVRNRVTTADGSSDFWAIWSGASGGLAPVAAEGLSTPLGGVYTGNWNSSLASNGVGDVLFGQDAMLEGVEQAGLWLHTGEGVEAICVEGEPSPIGFATYDAPWVHSAQVNDAGQIAYMAIIEGFNVDSSNDGVIFLREADGATSVVAREGDPAPGFPAGVVFGNMISSSLTLTQGGRVVFRHRLTGPGISDENDDTLWITRQDGGLSLLIRQGDGLLVGGEVRPVEVFGYQAGRGQGSGLRGSVNELGQVAIDVCLGDGGGGAVVVVTPDAACPGDTNKDGVVDSLDLNLLLAGFGGVGEPGAPGDFDLDGDIDSEDLNQVLVNFGDLCLSQS